MIAPILFGLCLAVQTLYWVAFARGFQRERARGPSRTSDQGRPISVVIAARNEAENLPSTLGALSRQEHDCFEVIVVDDGSTDGTADTVRSRASSDDRFRLIEVTPAEPRKKRALEAGIRAARFDRLVFTDADCSPGPEWLACIDTYADGDDAVVVGYSPFRSERGLINRISRFETFVTGFLTASTVGLGRPYMAVGRNLSYSRELFEELRGFEHSIRSLSGDDDLLVQEAIRHGARVRHPLDSRSFVVTTAPATWREWVRQKRRHTSAARFYRPSVKVHLLVFHTTGHVLWLAPFLAGVTGAGILAARLVLQWLALRRPAAVLGERDLMRLLPLWELAYAVYNVLVAPLGILVPPRSWRTGGERN